MVLCFGKRCSAAALRYCKQDEHQQGALQKQKKPRMNEYDYREKGSVAIYQVADRNVHGCSVNKAVITSRKKTCIYDCAGVLNKHRIGH